MTHPIQHYLVPLAIAGLLVAGLSGCGSSDPEPSVEAPAVSNKALTDEEKALALHTVARAGDMDGLRCSLKG